MLVLPGGTERSIEPSAWWRSSNLRMRPVAEAVARTNPGVAVHRIEYRLRGWNAPQLDPVQDARAALAALRSASPGLPVVLVGHSMGGRVAAHLAADPAVVGVVALAPWWPDGEGYLIPARRRLLTIHGQVDRWTSASASRQQTEAARARGVDATYLALPGAGHFMLNRPGQWHRLVAENGVRDTLDGLVSRRAG